jgi:hypothetical protein
VADFAALLQAIAALVTPLFWPAVVLIALILFRDEIRKLLARIRRGVIMGQEIELDELNRSADAAASEVAALPPSESDDQELQQTADEDIVRRVLDEAARSPKAALLLLASEMEREVRELLGAYGLLRGRRYVPFREAIQILQQQVGLPRHLPSSVELFWDTRNRLVHGGGASDDDVLRAIDSGITILRAVRAIPRATNVVYHPGVEVYTDPEGRQVHQDVRAVILETESPGGATKTHRVYPTTQTHYKKGRRVAWEWDLDRVFGECWYRDPDSEAIKYGWSQSGEFVGPCAEAVELVTSKWLALFCVVRRASVWGLQPCVYSPSGQGPGFEGCS